MTEQPKMVIVEPVPKEGPHGDRATEMTSYLDYNIHFAREGEDLGKMTLVHTVSGFDNFWAHVLDKTQVKEEAISYAENLASKAGLKVKVIGSNCCEVYEVSMPKGLILATSAEEAIEFYLERDYSPVARKTKHD